MSNVQTAVNAIRNMNNDELAQVIEAVKMQRTWLARTATRSLTVGDAVVEDAEDEIILRRAAALKAYKDRLAV